ncbi:MAG: ECF-type sigma factor [Verrucomicrobiota bacterium]|nr:ECF-type sigma factor [Verrucomicrobiota bacterium]
MPVVYNELRRLAGSYLRDERPNHTLQPKSRLQLGQSFIELRYSRSLLSIQL